jgi:putative membrane protein
MPISEADKARIAQAIREAEAQTSGQIVCVLARAASNYAYVPIVWAALVALAAPWPLIAFTQISVERIYIAQLTLFAAATLLLSLPRLRMALVPRTIRRVRAHRAAAEQFLARGVSRTKDRSGILIFVCLGERYARIIADSGIAARVPDTAWREAVDRLTAEIRAGRIADGFVAAVGACGRILGREFPARTDHANELPDRIYLL